MDRKSKRIFPSVYRGREAVLKRYQASQYQMAVMSAVKEKFADALAGLNDPAQRFQRFIEAINDGMPDGEAANAFLCLDADQYAQFLDENEEAAAIIQMFKARVAQDQYKKVTKSDDPRIALRWLEQNRPETWAEKKAVDVTSGGNPIVLSDDERVTRIAELLDAARARRAGQSS